VFGEHLSYYAAYIYEIISRSVIPFYMIKVTSLTMGPSTEWGPGQNAPVAPPPSRRP